ncbi:MAG: hypothetical protein KJ709_03415 [Nanoarchaeota archaeon]|nr:hypothetical protein [Nanoarchaeota archaeon]
MPIRAGTVDDLIIALPMICEMIPDKAGLTAEDVVRRLEGRKYGIQVYENGIKGIQVWYEDKGELYLWLGAVAEQGKGLMRQMLEELDSETSYKRWHVKVKNTYGHAMSLLKGFGFEEYGREGKVVYLEKKILK